MTSLAALPPLMLAVSAALLLVPAHPGRRLAATGRPRTSGRPLAPLGLLRAVLVGCVLVTGAVAPRASVLVAAAAVGVATSAQVVLDRHGARAATARRGEVARAARVLAGQLRVGQVPTVALRSAALDCPPLERAAAAQAVGGDVGAALREAARRRGYEGLVDLAMAWELAERAGAPIAALALRVSSSLAEVEQNRAAVAAELASPRASGRLLAALPLLGLAMGTLAGGEPLGFLLGTLPGQFCVLGGVGLAAAGVLWTEQLANRASR